MTRPWFHFNLRRIIPFLLTGELPRAGPDQVIEIWLENQCAVFTGPQFAGGIVQQNLDFDRSTLCVGHNSDLVHGSLYRLARQELDRHFLVFMQFANQCAADGKRRQKLVRLNQGNQFRFSSCSLKSGTFGLPSQGRSR